MTYKWLGKKLHSSIRQNPKIKLGDIQDKAHESWNIGITRSKAYRARKEAMDLVDGTHREQYRRLKDYCHELLRSNPGSTVKLLVDRYEEHFGEEEIIEIWKVSITRI
ncbi:MAG: hypothetical protein Q8736_02635 [Sweet potato little leaf phytoplasma]|nr:hypothetical protein [Sweet potato little leaf phytoplasma]